MSKKHKPKTIVIDGVKKWVFENRLVLPVDEKVFEMGIERESFYSSELYLYARIVHSKTDEDPRNHGHTLKNRLWEVKPKIYYCRFEKIHPTGRDCPQEIWSLN